MKGTLENTGTHAGAELRTVSKEKAYSNTGFDKCDFPLVEVLCEEYRGLVFVCLDTDNDTSLREYLGGMIPELDRVLYEPLEVFHYHETIAHTNWKLFCDNNREIYHVLLHYLNRRTADYASAAGANIYWTILESGHAIFGDPSKDVTHYDRTDYEGDRDLVAYPIPGVTEGAQPIYEIFPDVMINIRSNAVRIDRMIPIGPGETKIEWRGLGVKGDTPAIRARRVANHNLVWGPFGRNLAEDLTAVEAQWRTMSVGAAPFSIVAREEHLASMDDESLRSFYAEWSKRTGIDYADVAI